MLRLLSSVLITTILCTNLPLRAVEFLDDMLPDLHGITPKKNANYNSSSRELVIIIDHYSSVDDQASTTFEPAQHSIPTISHSSSHVIHSSRNDEAEPEKLYLGDLSEDIVRLILEYYFSDSKSTSLSSLGPTTLACFQKNLFCTPFDTWRRAYALPKMSINEAVAIEWAVLGNLKDKRPKVSGFSDNQQLELLNGVENPNEGITQAIKSIKTAQKKQLLINLRTRFCLIDTGIIGIFIVVFVVASVIVLGGFFTDIKRLYNIAHGIRS